MKVLKIRAGHIGKGIVEEAVKILEAGGVIVYPTETVYGLGANVFNFEAVQRVFEIKGRELSKPSSIAFRNMNEAKKLVIVNNIARKLSRRFLPGPLTLVLPAKSELDQFLGKDKVGVRIPANPIAQKILQKTKFPLTATSANLSGGKDPATAQDVIEQIGDKIDLILDTGRCEYGKPSTVVDLSENRIKILREGVISRKQLLGCLSS
jgi:L-threonylcarbamoyladenylate synthase